MPRLLLLLLGITIYGSRLLILSAYAPSMPSILSLPLSITCDDSDGWVTMAIGSYRLKLSRILAGQHENMFATEKDEIINNLVWQRIVFAAMAEKFAREEPYIIKYLTDGVSFEMNAINNMEEAGPSVTEKPINGSVHLDLYLENDDDDMMIDAPSVRDLDQPPEHGLFGYCRHLELGVFCAIANEEQARARIIVRATSSSQRKFKGNKGQEIVCTRFKSDFPIYETLILIRVLFDLCWEMGSCNPMAVENHQIYGGLQP
nr:hypothetical protein [Tanacetum cinerariifolium]